MERRKFLLGLGASVLGGGKVIKEVLSDEPKDVEQKPQVPSLVIEPTDTETTQVEVPEPLDESEKIEKKDRVRETESTQIEFAQQHVVAQEIESLIRELSPEAVQTLKRFYRNKHAKKECDDVKALLGQEWKRIRTKEHLHHLSSRHGLKEHDKANELAVAKSEQALERFGATMLERLQPFREELEQAAAEHSVPVWILAGVISIESQGNPKAGDPKKAYGMMQFMPVTARANGLRVDETVDERSNPKKSVFAGAKYLASLYRQTGQWSLALAGYSAGLGLWQQRIESAYQHAGVPAPDAAKPESLKKAGANLVTLYSKEFAFLGDHHSLQYPLFVEDVAQAIVRAQSKIEQAAL